MFVNLIRLCAMLYLVGAFLWIVAMPIGFGIAWMTVDDRPTPTYLYKGELNR